MDGFHYFSGCTDLDEARTRFRKLAFELHPDTGGSNEAFQELIAEFQRFQCFTWNNHGQAKWGASFKAREPGSYDLGPEAIERLRTVLRWPGVDVEIIGTWIWCRGETRPHKEPLKTLGFRWAPKKTAWCYHAEPYRKKHSRTLTWEEMRARYGSQTPQPQDDEARKAALPA